MDLLRFVSLAIGWIYTLCWSLSFYAQPLLNCRQRSTNGTTVDFPFINSFGYLAYFVSNLSFYYSPVIRSQYAFRNHGKPSAVQFNDIVFALHAMVLSIITTSQYFFPRLWRFSSSSSSSSPPRAGGGEVRAARPSRLMTGVFVGGILGVACTALMAAAGAAAEETSEGEGFFGDPSGRARALGWCELDVVYAVSYVKLLVTLVKYAPQVVLNYRNKSTRGWSMAQILLDFGGGVLSITQLAIDSYQIGDWSGVTGNPVKFALGNMSMLYDCVLMWQHYVSYAPRRSSSGAAGEREGLLGGRDDEERA